MLQRVSGVTAGWLVLSTDEPANESHKCTENEHVCGMTELGGATLLLVEERLADADMVTWLLVEHRSDLAAREQSDAVEIDSIEHTDSSPDKGAAMTERTRKERTVISYHPVTRR